MKKLTVFISFITAVIVVLAVVQVAVSNSLSTTGMELAKLEEQKKAYNRENSTLKEKLLIKASYTSIAANAKELGFIEEKSRLFLSTSLPLAVKP